MALAQKGRRNIEVDGASYRFSGGWRRRELLIAVEAAEGGRSRLIARFDPYALTGEEHEQDYLSKEHVRWAIQEARRRGWDPQHKGPPYELRTAALMGEPEPWPWAEDPVYRDLLQAVYRDLLDDGPRLVLADFLLERGDPRGELVRVQCKRGFEGTPEILRRHWKRWSMPVYTLARRWFFHRGFIETLRGCPLPPREAWEALHRREPVRSVELKLCPGQAEGLQWVPQPSHLELIVEGPLGVDAIDALLRSPWLQSLRSLRLFGLTDEAVSALAQSSRLEALRELELKGPRERPLGLASATALLVAAPRVQTVILHLLQAPDETVAAFRQRAWRLTIPERW